MTNTTETITTTTTQPSGTITIPVWIIYAIVIPIVCIAVVVGLIALIRWICSKRAASVLPVIEPEEKRIVNDLKSNSEQTEQNEVKGPFQHFTVSNESNNKLSKKPKKAVNCINKKDVSKTPAVDTEICKIKKKKVKAIAIKEEENIKEQLDGDAISENAFNHLKESEPTVFEGQIPPPYIRKSRSQSMNNTLKLNSKPKKSFIKPEPYLEQTLTLRRQRKPKESAKKRNLNIIKSKLNRPDLEDTDETSTDTNTSTVPVDTDEESVIDTSIVQSGDEDFITDDEDSAADVTNVRSSNNHTLDNDVIRENQIIHMSQQVKQMPDLSDSEISGKVVECQESLQDRVTRSTHLELSSLKDFNSTVKTLQTVGKDQIFAVDLKLENNSAIEMEQCVDAKFKETKILDVIKYDHVPREGPIASSSFKVRDNDKNEFQNKQTDHINETSFSCDLGPKGADEQQPVIDKKERNYLQFKEAVMNNGSINLNRSMSLNEGEQLKSYIKSKRRKRKYQSLRHAKRESVFDALQTLEKAPKKGILKKSQSLHLNERPNKLDTNIKEITPTTGQLVLEKCKFHSENEIESTNEAKIPDAFKTTEQSDTTDFCEILSSNLLTTIDRVTSNDDTQLDTPNGFGESSSEMFARNCTGKPTPSQFLTETNLNADKFSESDNEEQINQNESYAGERNEFLPSERRSGSGSLMNQNSITNEIGPYNDYQMENIIDESTLKYNSTLHQTSMYEPTSDNHPENKLENNENLLYFKSHNNEMNSKLKIVTHDERDEKLKDDGSFERDQMHSKEPDNDHSMNPSPTVKTNQKGNKKLCMPGHSLESDSSLELIEIPSASPGIDDIRGKLNEDSTIKQTINLPVVTLNANVKEFDCEQIFKKEELSNVPSPNVFDALKETPLELKKHDTTSVDFHNHRQSHGNNTKNMSLSSQHSSIALGLRERPATPHLSSTDMNSKSIVNNSSNLLNKVFRHKSNPSFDRAHLELLQSHKSNVNQLNKRNISQPLSPIVKEDEPKNISLTLPPNLGGNNMPLETSIRETTAQNAPLEEKLYSNKADKCTSKQIKSHRSKSFIPTAQMEDEMTNDVETLRAGVLSPIKMKNKSTIEKKSLDTIILAGTSTNGINQHNKEHGRIRSPVFNVRNNDIRIRSKTPSVELERVGRNLNDPKRSKTPMPVPSYFMKQSEGTVAKPFLTHPLSKLKTGYSTNTNMETFSRNVPSVLEEKRKAGASFRRSMKRFPNRNVPVSDNTKTNEHTLLYRREKETNVLDEKVEFKRISVRERPKSAMSMRSAPRMTSQDNVTPFPRKFRTDNRLRQKTGEHRRSITPTLTHDDKSSDSRRSSSRAESCNAFDVQQANYDLDESDSELEAFFANPDVKSLQFGNKDLLNNGYTRSHRTVFSTFSKRNDLAKSKSFKM